MLQRIRDNASGPLAYVVVAVITLVFGVWGIGSYFTPSADPVVASVGGTDITRYQLRQAYQRRYQRLRQLMGDNFDPSLVPPEQLRRTVLQSLINNAVIDRYAREAGYRVTDAGLLAAIRSNQQFQVDGQFSRQRYQAMLRQAGLAPAQYEAGLREDLKSQQVRREIANSAFAAPAEVEQAYRLANQQRRVQVLPFNPADYREQVDVSDADIKRYYEDNPERFQRPERVKLAYVELNRANVKSDAPADEQTLRTLYDEHKSGFGTPAKRSGARIRVPIEGEGDQARDTIQKLAGASGDSLQAKAREADDNIDYQVIEPTARDALPAAVAEVLFDLDKGETSNPVRGDGAWYLVSLDAITPASTPAFDDPDVQARLKSMASAQRAETAFQDKAERLESLAFEAPNDLQTLADELGLQIKHTDWLTRAQGEGIGQYDAVRKAAFSDAVYKDELNSTSIQLGADRRLVLRVADQQAAQRRSLEDVRGDIREQLVAREATQQAREAANEALEKLQSDGDLQALADDGGAELQSLGYIRRDGGEIDPRVREAAFGMAKPAEDKRGYAVAATRDSAIALVVVDDVREAANDETRETRQRFVAQQRNYIAGLEYAAFNAFLRNNAAIEIHEDRIN